MRYALRFSSNIAGDIRRGWSAWMGMRYKSLRDLVEDEAMRNGLDLNEEWERWQDESWEPYFHRDCEDEQAFLEDVAERCGIPVGFDEDSQEWCWIHHYGLAAYELQAEAEAEAIEEGRALAAKIGLPSGDGVVAKGDIRVVAEVGENWYVLECDEIGSTLIEAL